MQPKVNYPAVQIVGPGASTGVITASSSTVLKAPTASSGYKPSFFRISITAGSAHVKWGANTAITAVTSDTVLSASEALYINGLGVNAFAAIQPAAGATAGAIVNVMACEEGSLRPTSDTSGLG